MFMIEDHVNHLDTANYYGSTKFAHSTQNSLLLHGKHFIF